MRALINNFGFWRLFNEFARINYLHELHLLTPEELHGGLLLVIYQTKLS